MPRNFGRFCMMLGIGLSMFVGGCGPISFTVGSGPSGKPIRPTTVIRETGYFDSTRIAVIDVKGLISNSSPVGFLSRGENPVSLLHHKLEAARRDHAVKAVILRLNTPGGTVTASDAMYREVKRFKAKSGKPVVAMMQDVAASGGYYLSCAADRIVAYPTTVTASIGVIMQLVSVKRGLGMIGVDPVAITSGPNKAAGSPLDELKEEHKKLMRRMVNDFYGRFREVVRKGRSRIPKEHFDRLTDGRVVTGAEAKQYGLVDELGDIYTAFAVAKKLAKVKRADLVVYRRGTAPGSSPYAKAPVGRGGNHVGTQINLAQINLGDGLGIGDGTATFMYLWRPSVE